MRSFPLSRPDAVNVAHMVERCRVLGPGERFIIWVQGCSLRCAGCHNPQFQPFEDRTWISTKELASMILTVKGIEGVTYVGGEPFAQAEALSKVSKQLRSTGLTVMSYTGFTLDELGSKKFPHAKALLRETDLLMDGPYRRDLTTNRPWRGSENQQLISLSDQYCEKISEWNAPIGQQFEIRLSDQGEVIILGIPPAELTGIKPTGQSITNQIVAS